MPELAAVALSLAAAEALLSLKAACTNWDAALASPACQATDGGAWEGAMPCGGGGMPAWRGVTCNPQGAVTKL